MRDVNSKIIYAILKALEKSMDYDAPDMSSASAEKLEVSENRRNAILIMLIDGGFVAAAPLRITLKGLEWLSQIEDSLKKRKHTQAIKNRGRDAIHNTAEVIEQKQTS